jgi:hypothetical protein
LDLGARTVVHVTAMVATVEQDAGAPALRELPRLRSVEIGGWPGLADAVRIDLAGARTVLVGKNGAGKSLVLEGIFRATTALTGVAPAPRTFRCEVEIPGGEVVGYEYALHTTEPDDDLDLPVRSARARARAQLWEERCWRLDGGDDLWRAAEGRLSIRGAPPVPIPPTGSVLGLDSAEMSMPTEVEPLVDLLSRTDMVPAGIPRSSASARQEILLSGTVRRWRPQRPGDRIGYLAWRLVLLQERRRETYDEFVAIVQKLGLARDVQIKIYKDPEPGAQEGERQDFASVLIDDVNIGLLSDGTLRIFEIVSRLLGAPGSVLLIEEPETAVHPGLLRKLLALIDAYILDRQVVVTTHSPIVVDWCKPEELRLVERTGKNTVVRALSDEQVARVRAYLDDEGTFAEYLYSRSDEV